MLIGYARVSTPEQLLDHQIDALRRAGVANENIHCDVASGAKASRPELDLVLQLLRAGDTLVITRLDRLSRSVLHLVTLGAQLREREVGLKVTEQGIDTATAEGRAMFGMLSVLAELQRELIVANTRDGLAAARARGRRGGRRPALTKDQAALAQRLYDAGEHTVQQIADIVRVPRTTIYGHLAPTAQPEAVAGAEAQSSELSEPVPAEPGPPSSARASLVIRDHVVAEASLRVKTRGRNQFRIHTVTGTVTAIDPPGYATGVVLVALDTPIGERTTVSALVSNVRPLKAPGQEPRRVDLSGELGVGWQLVRADRDQDGEPFWHLQLEDTHIGTISRHFTSRGRAGWQGVLTEGTTVPAPRTLATATDSTLWRTRGLAAAGIAEHVHTHPARLTADQDGDPASRRAHKATDEAGGGEAGQARVREH